MFLDIELQWKISLKCIFYLVSFSAINKTLRKSVTKPNGTNFNSDKSTFSAKLST